ncbi:MAG: ABC transporter substrate-binding protein, partial [Proteobacteria bacterium]|nr:ABC transporter substrate-binding protein [Pseudomonadota bacterium]
MTRSIGVTATVMLATSVATAHAETRPRYGGVVEASLLGAPVTLDPALAQTHAELEVAALIFDTLYALDAPDGIAHPHLAIQLPIVDGAQTTVRIPLVKGARFHDGSELTAADVVASLERARKGPARFALAAIATIRADGDALELVLRTPLPDLAVRLALPQLSITKGGRAPGERPIGSGPFVVDGLDRGKRVLALHAFDDHFAGRPYLDQLALRWYDSPDGEARRYETNASQVSARGVAAFAGGQPMYRASELEGPATVLA